MHLNYPKLLNANMTICICTMSSYCGTHFVASANTCTCGPFPPPVPQAYSEMVGVGECTFQFGETINSKRICDMLEYPGDCIYAAMLFCWRVSPHLLAGSPP